MSTHLQKNQGSHTRTSIFCITRRKTGDGGSNPKPLIQVEDHQLVLYIYISGNQFMRSGRKLAHARRSTQRAHSAKGSCCMLSRASFLSHQSKPYMGRINHMPELIVSRFRWTIIAHGPSRLKTSYEYFSLQPSALPFITHARQSSLLFISLDCTYDSGH